MDKQVEELMQDKRLTVHQASLELGVTEETVRRYIREGKLQAAKVKTVGLRRVWGILPASLEKIKNG